MEDNIQAIEAGKQRGLSKSTEINGVKYWCGAAIQKQGQEYFVHVYVIDEENMAQEKYEVYFTRIFPSLDEAVKSIDSNGHVKYSEFNALKGQKLFNPGIHEENET